MYSAAIISGLTLGFMGSFHCVGMCGPIALSLPIHHQNVFQKSLSILLYHLGKASTYALLGLFFGAIGLQVRYFGFQQIFSILLGIGLIASVVFTQFFNFSNSNIFSKSLLLIKQKLGRLLQSPNTFGSVFLVGLLNGLLPCGMVYVAIITGLATGSATLSTVLLFSFGIGTLPLMTALMVFHKMMSLSFRQKINKITPFFIAIIGLLLIFRGLNLNIPYLSPIFPIFDKGMPMCN